MALYRLELRRLSRRAPPKSPCGQRQARYSPSPAIRGKRTISAAAAYRAAGLMPIDDDGTQRRRVADFRRRRGVDARPVLVPDAAPAWARERTTLWREVDRTEKRPDALLAHEFLLTLPVETTLDAAAGAVEAWANDELVAQGMVADVTVHRYGSALDLKQSEHRERIDALQRDGWPVLEGDLEPDDPRASRPHILRPTPQRAYVYQPHAHVLATTRPFKGDSFGNKERTWGQKAHLYQCRKSWENAYNRLLEENDIDHTVDCRARWRRRKDAAPTGTLRDALRASVQPADRALHLGEGAFAARRGRPPADPPQRDNRQRQDRPAMKPDDFNRALAIARGEKPATSTVTVEETLRDWKELHELVSFAHELEADGVRFFEKPESGTLAYAAPQDRPITREEYRRFAGMHEPVVLALRQHGTLCRDAEDADRQVPKPGRDEPESQPRERGSLSGADLGIELSEDLNGSNETLELDATASNVDDTAAARARAGREPSASAPSDQGDRDTASAATEPPSERKEEAKPAPRSTLCQQLEERFEVARNGGQPHTSDDPEVDWIVDQFADENRARRRVESKLRQVQKDLGNIWDRVQSLVSSEHSPDQPQSPLAKVQGWIKAAWDRVASPDEHEAQATPSRGSRPSAKPNLVLFDPRDGDARNRAFERLKKMSGAEKISCIKAGLEELGRGHHDESKVRAGLKLLNGMLVGEARKQLSPELLKRLEEVAKNDRPGSNPLRGGRTPE